MEYHDLEEYVDLLIAAEDVAQHKPHPEGLETALSHFGGHPPVAVMVGDSFRDTEAAQAINVDSVLFYPDNHTLFYEREILERSQPTFVAESWQEVQTIFDQKNTTD